jgi:FkbM family methyltransferase
MLVMSAPRVETEIINYPFTVHGQRAKRMCLLKDDALTVCIKTVRFWEYNTRIQLYAQMARGGSYVEVGANLGTDTILAADYFKVCHLFEPSTRHAEILKQNMEMNEITNFRLCPAAVSDHCGTSKLYYGVTENTGSAALAQNLPGMDRFEDVQLVTLDSALPEVTDVTWLHIDAEGHDIKVLQGAKKFIARQTQRPFIKMEFQPKSLTIHGSDISELIRFLEEFRYNAFFEANNYFVPLSYGILVEMFYGWRKTQGWIDIYLKA